MFLGLFTKKELRRQINNEKIKSYKNGYSDAREVIDYLNTQLAVRDEKINDLEKENRSLKRKIREERHEEIRQIRAIASRTKKLRVKKKCEARLLKIRLSR